LRWPASELRPYLHAPHAHLYFRPENAQEILDTKATAPEIRRDDLSGQPTQELLAFHWREMRAHSPPGQSFALDIDSLRAPEIEVYSAWFPLEPQPLAAVAALRDLGDGTAELKSMRTHPNHLRRGVASALLVKLIATAREKGLKRLSLETGSGYPHQSPQHFFRYFTLCTKSSSFRSPESQSDSP
jgi:putative acetyltransferase